MLIMVGNYVFSSSNPQPSMHKIPLCVFFKECLLRISHITTGDFFRLNRVQSIL